MSRIESRVAYRGEVLSEVTLGSCKAEGRRSWKLSAASMMLARTCVGRESFPSAELGHWASGRPASVASHCRERGLALRNVLRLESRRKTAL